MKHPIGFRRHFQRHLVGFNHQYGLIFFYRIPVILEPLGKNRFPDRFPHAGDSDFNDHAASIILCPCL